MPVQLPYLASYKNVGPLFEKIASAKVPDNFTQEFLKTTIGLKASTDRPLIPFLRNLGFIDQSGRPTASYNLLKGPNRKAVWAAGIRKAYGPLFDADQQAHQLSGEKLKSLVAQVAGTDDDMTARIANTFAAVAKFGDFDSAVPDGNEERKREGSELDVESEPENKHRPRGVRSEFHYNLQIHLPSKRNGRNLS
jgi:Family of unknown function (DUF5343)